MQKFSAKYIDTDCGFVFQNLDRPLQTKMVYYPVLCILKNLLQRGNPTQVSEYLAKQFPDAKSTEIIYLIDQEKAIWENTIKGDSREDNYPAKIFFEEMIPRLFGYYAYIQPLFLPEVSFKDITEEENKRFINEQVDFYLPQAKLVVEIDGYHHRNQINRIGDKERDEYLAKHGYKTIRIPTNEQRVGNGLEKHIEAIRVRLRAFHEELQKYKIALANEMNSSWYKKEEVKLIGCMRLQILLIELLMRGYLRIDQPSWQLNILKNEPVDFEKEAIEDFFIWFENLCKLAKINFSRPKVSITHDIKRNDKGAININFSLLKRYTDENEIDDKWIYVRNDYFPDRNYFKLQTAQPIQYELIKDGKDNDIDHLEFFLKNIFKLDKFREGQAAIICNILEGHSTIGLLPTGGGKSVCYQLPCLLQPCANFVVAPIKALMHDQERSMKEHGIEWVKCINSNLDGEEKEEALMEYQNGRYFMVLISPERFQTKDFREKISHIYSHLSIAYAVIDEVHCLSEWGHDFRTSYLQLCSTIRRFCPNVKLVGLTATASINVLNDIQAEFGIGREDTKTLLHYTRDELHFHVKKIDQASIDLKRDELFKLLDEKNKQQDLFKLADDKTKGGLIFCVNKSGKAGCYDIATRLQARYDTPVGWYCGECPKIGKKSVMDPKEFEQYKMDIQDKFIKNEIALLAATKAFGMGIDKSNIRYTIHFGIPGSLESLYQEAGRAGRDKKNADCYVIYSKDKMEQADYDKLFMLDTSIEEIEEITEKYHKNYGEADVLRNLFLWKISNKGEIYEKYLMLIVFNYFAEPGKQELIELKQVKKCFVDRMDCYISRAVSDKDKKNLTGAKNKGVNSSDLQKAVYKLALLGIVDDWTVEKWEERCTLEVSFKKYTDQSVKKSLEDYIKKYVAGFSFERPNKDYERYINIISKENKKLINRCIEIIVAWGYDKIFYKANGVIDRE